MHCLCTGKACDKRGGGEQEGGDGEEIEINDRPVHTSQRSPAKVNTSQRLPDKVMPANAMKYLMTWILLFFRQKALEPDRMKSPGSPKSNFKNTDFIDVAPVVRTNSKMTIGDQEEMVEVKVEAGTSFEFGGDEQIFVGEPDASEEHVDKEDYQNAEWESEPDGEDGEEAGGVGGGAGEDVGEREDGGGGVVKLQPRVSFTRCSSTSKTKRQNEKSVISTFALFSKSPPNMLQDEKTLQAESLKEIKHKTKCKVCQGEFKNRQVLKRSILFVNGQPFKVLPENVKISGQYLLQF